MKNLPRETTIAGQRHMLAYINPFEVDLLRSYGGQQTPGPGGVPAFPPSAAQVKDIERQRAEREAQRDDRAPSGTYSGTGTRTVSTPAGSRQVSVGSQPPSRTGTVQTTAELRSATAAREASDRSAAQARVDQLLSDQRDDRPSVPNQNVGAPRVVPRTSAGAAGPTPLVGPATPEQLEAFRSSIGQRNMLESAFGSTLPGQIILGLRDRQLQTVADKLSGTYENQGILGLGIGKGLFDRGAVSYQAVFDPKGNIVGALGFDEAGAPVDYSGQRIEGFDSGNEAINALVRPSEAGLAGSERDEGPSGMASDPCPEGYEMDPVSRVCRLKQLDVVAQPPTTPPPPPVAPPLPSSVPLSPYTQVPAGRPPVPPLAPYTQMAAANPAVPSLLSPYAQQTIYTPPPTMQGQGIMQNLR